MKTLIGGAYLHRLRRRWRTRLLHGSEVLVSRDIGPAVAGVLRPRIVIPAWMDALPGQELVVAHELEHLRARDGQVLAAATLAVALVPWNPVAWWSFRRLRLALELDCDRRVVRAFPGRVREYCELLLQVGSRGARPLASPALSEPQSILERRVDAMTRPRTPSSRARTLTLSALASAVAGFACFYPSPDGEMTDPLAVAMDAADLNTELTDGPVFTPYTVAPDLRNMEQVRDALEAEYPPLLRDAGIGGTVNVWFLINAGGDVVETRIQQSSGHEAIDRAAMAVAGMMSFSPARNRDKAVPVWVAFPITFMPN